MSTTLDPSRTRSLHHSGAELSPAVFRTVTEPLQLTAHDEFAPTSGASPTTDCARCRPSSARLTHDDTEVLRAWPRSTDRARRGFARIHVRAVAGKLPVAQAGDPALSLASRAGRKSSRQHRRGLPTLRMLQTLRRICTTGPRLGKPRPASLRDHQRRRHLIRRRWMRRSQYTERTTTPPPTTGPRPR
jgi:hypothetical protein